MSSSGPSIGVVIVGESTVRTRIEEEIARRDDQLVIGSVDADQGVATAVGRAPDVVIITSPPGGDPDIVELGRAIGAALPATRILVATDGGSAANPEGLIDAWVCGVVDLADGVSVADAVEQVFLGEAILDPPLAGAVLARHGQGGSANRLTATEEEVLNRVAAGDTVDALAADYAVTARLVRLHLGGALARLHPQA